MGPGEGVMQTTKQTLSGQGPYIDLVAQKKNLGLSLDSKYLF